VDEMERWTERDGVVRGSEDQVIWMKDVNCQGDEEYLTDCSHNRDTTLCSHNEDIMMR